MGVKMKNKKKPAYKYVSIQDIKRNIEGVSALYKSYVDFVEECKNIVEANYELNTKEGRSKVKPKTIKAIHNYSASALSEGLLSDYDIIDAIPVGSDDLDDAMAQKQLINYQLNEEMEFDLVVDKAARYFEDFGSFYLKLSWNYKERVKKTAEKEYKELPANITEEQYMQLQQAGRLTEDNKIIVDKEITTVVSDHPVIELKKYNQIVLGPSTDGSNTLDSLEFICDRYYSNIASLEATGKYKNLDKLVNISAVDDLDVNALPDSDFDAMMDDILEEDKNRTALGEGTKVDKYKPLVVTEYWTKVLNSKNQLETVVVTYVGNTIIREEKSPYGEEVGYPFARGIYYQSLDNKLYDGIPDTVDLEDDQLITGAVTRGIIDIMGRTANGRIGVANSFLDPIEEKKFEDGDNFKFNPSLHPVNAVWQEKFPEIPNSALTMLQITQSNSESISGKKLFGQGLSSSSYGEVAAGVKAVTDATVQRLMSNVRKFNKPFVHIFKKMAELNKKFITDDKIIALSDKSFTTIRPDELKTSINIKLSVATPEINDKKANDLAFILQTLGDSVDYSVKQVMLADIARLKQRPDLAKAISSTPPPQPSQQELELHQLQVELLKAQIANEKAKAYENQTDGVLNEAKASTEEAKKDVLYSSKDLQDLDFIHKREGTDVERQKEIADKSHVDSMEKTVLNHMLQGGNSSNEINPANKPTGFNKGQRPDKMMLDEVMPDDEMPDFNGDEIPVIDMPTDVLQPSDFIK
jgi:hypothetical protein